MAKTKCKKKRALPVPKTRSAAESMLGEIGRLQREVAGLENEMNAELAATKERFTEQAQPLNEQIDVLFSALHAWAESHREEILRKGSKTAKLATGELSWRTCPPSVTVRNQEKVIEELRAKGLSHLVRVKHLVDKPAVLAEPEAVKGIRGVSISQKEEFVARPFESEIERAETVAASTKRRRA